MSVNFVHLRTHTEYSIADGLLRIKPLVKAVAARGMPAVAVTDLGNLFAVVKFYRAALAQGIKPLIGADLIVESASGLYAMTFLCSDNRGYQHLIQLISKAYLTNQQHGKPLVKIEWLADYAGGLIVLSGGVESSIATALLKDQRDLAEQELQQWLQWFPQNFYLEINRVGAAQEERYIQAVLPLAQQYQVPIVATNKVCFLDQDDFEAHEARVCIHDGAILADPNRVQRYTVEQYLKSADEMTSVFADLPIALSNSVQIAKRCNVNLDFNQVYLPDFPVPAGQTIAEFIIAEAHAGLTERLKKLFKDRSPAEQAQQREIYEARLNTELSVINAMGFPGYFLIVADFIAWAKTHGVAVGPGRGSGAGSLVAYALKITDLDPIEYQLLFERFLNPERVSMPDFDVDFCMEKRDLVIEYVANKYGRASVSQIITYGTMAAKAVVRDVGRVLGHPYGFVDRIAKLIPFELGITLSKVLADEAGALASEYRNSEEVKGLIDLALRLEGITRNAGKHAGGVVIAPSALTDFTAVYCQADGSDLVTQFDKDDVEAVGLVKFDFLGLRTLTIIDWTVQRINRKRALSQEPTFAIEDIALDDEATYKLLQACQTTAVFQLESRGMKDLIRRLQPSQFEDIIDLGALFRPGPLQSGMVDDFVDRKHGRAAVVYDHPDLEPLLKVTNGVILYQEQVMQIAQVLAGYTLGGADLLRRAMGKKKPEEMAKQRAIFLAGAEQRGVDGKVANGIFDLMEKFSGYGFNKSHSAAYALLTYQTAWLKAHYPAAFMAAVLSSDMDHTDKVVKFIEECRALNLNVVPPHINQSQYEFVDEGDDQITYGLGAIKGVGQAAIENIIQQRQRLGGFNNLFQFCQEVDLRKVNRRVLEALIRSGSFDSFGETRATLLASLDLALRSAEQVSKNKNIGQFDLFGDSATFNTQTTQRYVAAEPLNLQQQLQGEKDTLGFYLSGHPLDRYRRELKQFTTASLANLTPGADQSVVLAGLIVDQRTMLTKRGDRMAFITLEDHSGRLEIAVFSDLYKLVQPSLIKDNLVVVEGEVSVDNFSGGYRISCRQLYDMTRARLAYRAELILEITPALDLQQLKALLSQHRGTSCAVKLFYQSAEGRVPVTLPGNWSVDPSDDLLTALQALVGEDAAYFSYPNRQSV